MLKVLRERLTLVLIGLLPFHAFLVTVGTRVLKGPNVAPWTTLAMWKEILVVWILLIALVEIANSFQLSAISLQKEDVNILILVLLGVVLLLSGKPESIQQFAYGFKYTLFPLCLYLVLRRVEWSEGFKERCVNVILITGGIVATYGVLTLVLPPEFFHVLGYSKMHSLYIPESPVAAFQNIGSMGLRRVQSTMSGPNQLGLWLLLPYSIALLRFIAVRRRVLLLGLLGLCIVLTFSRAAWIAAVVVTVLVVWQGLPTALAKKVTVRAVGVFVLAVAFAAFVTPQVILRFQSSMDHIHRPLEAVQTIVRYPLGLGLGTAGPATNRFSDACVFLEEGADASWAEVHSDLCVYTGEKQVQPLDRVCSCPVLPENWYLQVGIELGIVGLVLFVTLILILLRNMLRSTRLRRLTPTSPRQVLRNNLVSMPEKLLGKPNSEILQISLVVTFIGVSIAALVLHAWEDAAVAYGMWVLMAVLYKK